jgi:hypothetical protein
MKKNLLTLQFLLFCTIVFSQSIIIDHTCTSIDSIPESAINSAKQVLHIAYGHTSHGSQLISGMDKLDDFKGGTGLFDWHDGPQTGSLDIDDRFASGDLGHNGDTVWAARTRTYLNSSNHDDVNVVMWSWCGGVSNNSTAGIQIYLDKMNELEQAYPNVVFVYMTGHADIGSDTNLKVNNQQIRDYCNAHNKVLFDFHDIERYDPDGKFFEFINDDCSYYQDASNSNKLGNWALEWQSSHTKGVDWYDCSAAHTQALNGNLKAYAAWWLWSRLAGWAGTSAGVDANEKENANINVYPNPVLDYLHISVSNDLSNSILSVFGVEGKLVKTIEVSDNSKNTVNMQDLKKGFYFIKSEQGDVAKFVKR